MNMWRMSWHAVAVILALAWCALAPTHATAAPIKIVAIGASNTSGFGFVGAQGAYPERLQALLRARGYDVEVVNAGVWFDTTNGMLARIGSAVPNGTRVVIIQPGGNDLRFLGTKERRTNNINAMVARLQARGIKTIVYDPEFPPEDYQWDHIHINAAGHAKIAAALLPQVIAALGPRQTEAVQHKSGPALTLH